MASSKSKRGANRPIALVTGASSGIGAATAKRLLQAGYMVFGASRSMPSIDTGVIGLKLDVTDPASVAACVSEVMLRAGRIDVLVNNAGYTIAASIEETSISQAKAIFETNVFGALRMVKAVLPIMRKQGYGRIINTSSVLGFLPAPFGGIYAATKHALEAISESLDHEVRHLSVRSVLIEPAFTATALVDHNAKAEEPLEAYADVRNYMDTLFAKSTADGDDPDDVARLIVRVAKKKSPKVRYATGKQAKLLAVLRRLMPSSMFEQSLRKQFGLDKVGVRPIA